MEGGGRSRAPATWLLAAALSICVAIALSSCSSTPSAAPATTTTAGSTNSAHESSTTSTTVAGTGRSSTSTVPLQAPTGGEFLSPSGNISCQIDNGRAGLHQVYCQTLSPPQSVTLSVAGSLTKCSGQQCLGNPGTGAPTLPYGSSTGSGPFLCQSSENGMTCTASGKGFLIARAGIATVDPG